VTQRQPGPVYSFRGVSPRVADGVFVAPTAAVIGDVTLAEGASVWFSAVVRGDDMPIRIGRGTNIQDGAVVHATEAVAAVEIGEGVVVGHRAVLHGCSVGDGAMIGIGAVVLDGATIGAGAVIAAGTIVPPNKHVPPGELWVGNPGAPRRPANDADRAFVAYATAHYRSRADQYLADGFGVKEPA
jgi:carbonic anhydrase/acetyltransferase-like protein (isoleucine patch superfamily)